MSGARALLIIAVAGLLLVLALPAWGHDIVIRDRDGARLYDVRHAGPSQRHIIRDRYGRRVADAWTSPVTGKTIWRDREGRRLLTLTPRLGRRWQQR